LSFREHRRPHILQMLPASGLFVGGRYDFYGCRRSSALGDVLYPSSANWVQAVGNCAGRFQQVREALGDVLCPVLHTRKQAIDLQAAILAALQKRDGAMVVGEGSPARVHLRVVSDICAKQKMEANMNLRQQRDSSLGMAICITAVSASNRTALAQSPGARPSLEAQQSLGVECRAAARAEIQGPGCRMSVPPTYEDSCNMWSHTQIAFYDNKVVECVARGGPGRKSKT
jgi:hypothetical protein